MQRIVLILFACWCAVVLAGCPTPTRPAYAGERQTAGGTTQLWVHVSDEVARDEAAKEMAKKADDAGGNSGDAGQKRRTVSVDSRSSSRAALAKTLDATDCGVVLLVFCLGVAMLAAARVGAWRSICAVLVVCLIAACLSGTCGSNDGAGHWCCWR